MKKRSAVTLKSSDRKVHKRLFCLVHFSSSLIGQNLQQFNYNTQTRLRPESNNQNQNLWSNELHDLLEMPKFIGKAGKLCAAWCIGVFTLLEVPIVSHKEFPEAAFWFYAA